MAMMTTTDRIPNAMKASHRTSAEAHRLHLPDSQNVFEEQQSHPLQEKRVVLDFTIEVEMHWSCQDLSDGMVLTQLQLISKGGFGTLEGVWERNRIVMVLPVLR